MDGSSEERTSEHKTGRNAGGIPACRDENTIAQNNRAPVETAFTPKTNPATMRTVLQNSGP